MITEKTATMEIRPRHGAALGFPAILLRIAFHALLALTALWVYECILGNAYPTSIGFEGWSGFPLHYDTWIDATGGPIVDRTEEKIDAIRWNTIICVGTSLLLGMLLYIIGGFAFRKPSDNSPATENVQIGFRGHD